jgi:hypothetical protein
MPRPTSHYARHWRFMNRSNHHGLSTSDDWDLDTKRRVEVASRLVDPMGGCAQNSQFGPVICGGWAAWTAGSLTERTQHRTDNSAPKQPASQAKLGPTN